MAAPLLKEEDWGFTEWSQWLVDEYIHSFFYSGLRKFSCCFNDSPLVEYGDTLDEAARRHTISWCENQKIGLPFRQMPDLSTEMNCLRVITIAGGVVHLFPVNFSDDGSVHVWSRRNIHLKQLGRYYGNPNEPWTLEALQAAARYVVWADGDV